MNRRDLLKRIVQGFAVVGTGFVLYPFARVLVPDFKSDSSLNVSLADLQPGESKRVHWLGRKVIVRRQSAHMIDFLTHGSERLKDPDSRHSSQPHFADNVFRARRQDVFVAFDNCTHLGCEVTPVDDHGIGFQCPCHNSGYDYAGRVLTDALATRNLEVPWYQLVDNDIVKLDIRNA